MGTLFLSLLGKFAHKKECSFVPRGARRGSEAALDDRADFVGGRRVRQQVERQAPLLLRPLRIRILTVVSTAAWSLHLDFDPAWSPSPPRA